MASHCRRLGGAAIVICLSLFNFWLTVRRTEPKPWNAVAVAGQLESPIPRVIMHTWRANDVPPRVFQAWKELNPFWELKFFNDTNVEEFLNREFGQQHLNFFKSMAFGRYKSDFFRYCYLYKKGGVYADIDMQPMVPISSFLNPGVDFFTVVVKGEHHIFQSYLASTPGHTILQRAIDKMLEIGPRVGIDPPDSPPFDGHPTRCLYDIIEDFVERNDTDKSLAQQVCFSERKSATRKKIQLRMGLWRTLEHGRVQLAEERPPWVLYRNQTIARSRYSNFKREKGFKCNFWDYVSALLGVAHSPVC